MDKEIIYGDEDDFRKNGAGTAGEAVRVWLSLRLRRLIDTPVSYGVLTDTCAWKSDFGRDFSK